MFYEIQPQDQQRQYKRMLSIIGNLTQLFSESNTPYLPYRCHENIFCKYFEAENLGRLDCSADAQKGKIGVGLKTWMGNDDQKIAEFGRLRPEYEGLTGIELVKKIAEYRNERIRVTKNMRDIDEMIYHIVKRVPGKMKILEHAFDYIDIGNINIIKNRGNANNTYFTDGKHTYHFSISKNTLYMIFSNLEELDSIDVNIMADPYSFLMNSIAPIPLTRAKYPSNSHFSQVAETSDYGTYYTGTQSSNLIKSFLEPQRQPKEQLCLRLYSVRRGRKYVADRSGLNQWNGGRRNTKTNVITPRNPDELYIPYPAEDRQRNPGFFPKRNIIFELKLPDGTVVPAKVCQEAIKGNPHEGKAIMSNPNKVLGKWLLRKVFELPEGTLVTYDMLLKFGIDSVIFTKEADLKYSVDFADLGTYEKFYGDESVDEEE